MVPHLMYLYLILIISLHTMSVYTLTEYREVQKCSEVHLSEEENQTSSDSEILPASSPPVQCQWGGI